jgi:hypothetical protein
VAVKLTMFFQAGQDPRVVGWSENVYLNYANVANAQFEVTDPQGYCAKRVQMLGVNVVNSANRLTQVNTGPPPVNPVRRNTVLLAGLTPTVSVAGLVIYNKLLASFTADFAQTVWLLRLLNSQADPILYSRSFWVRALPDLAQETDIPAPVAGAWQTAIVAWQNYVENSGKIVLQVDDRSGANPIKPCTAYNGPLNQYTVPAHGFVNGNLVVAEGWRGVAGARLPRGQYRVGVVDANTITLVGGLPLGTVTVLGGFKLVSYQFPGVATIIARGFTNKKVGRPFGLLAGRRRVATRPKA